MDAALVVAIVGAESTGKTMLAATLAGRVEALTGLTATWVPEALRCWCEAHGRTPRADEQPAIAAAQQRAIERAARKHAVVVADTTPLMTAVDSRLLFGDRSLEAAALAFQRRCALTVVTALDLPWVADGLQRDGPHVQQPVDDLLRNALLEARLPWALVTGRGPARSAHALDAIAPLLRARQAPRTGPDGTDRRWRCAGCDDPDCERRSRLVR
jgi:nicotinamide riboside kinase